MMTSTQVVYSSSHINHTHPNNHVIPNYYLPLTNKYYTMVSAYLAVLTSCCFPWNITIKRVFWECETFWLKEHYSYFTHSLILKINTWFTESKTANSFSRAERCNPLLLLFLCPIFKNRTQIKGLKNNKPQLISL